MSATDIDYHSLFDASPNPYLVLDRSLNIVGANKAYLAATKRELGDIVGRWAWDAFPTDPETLKRSIASFERVIRTRQPDTMALLRFDIPRPESEGGGFEVRYWSITHAPVLNQAGEVELVLQHPIDVTELQRLREGAQAAESALETRLAPAVSGIVDRAQTVHEANLRLKDEIEARQAAELQLRASEEKYRVLFANMAEGFALCELLYDGQGAPVNFLILEANEAFHQETGLPPGIVGRPAKEFLPQLEQHWLDAFASVIRTGRSLRLENRNADTRRIYDVTIFRPRPGQFAVVFRDITAVKRTQEALQDSERRYKALFNNRTSAVAHLRVVTDRDGKPVDYYFDAINDQWEQLMGRKREQVVGRLGTEVFPGLREQAWDPVEHLGRIALEGGEGLFEIHFRPTRQWVSIHAYSPKRGECTVIFTDISERKTAEARIQRLNAELDERVRRRTAELERANEALLKSNIELQRFAYVASHDLQTPLRTIVGFSQLLQANLQQHLDQENRDLLNRVIKATRRMHALILDLLSYARVESQAKPYEPVDFGEILQSVLLTLDESIRATGAAVSHGEMPVVLGDRGQLIQVLQNLIENGIKYHGPEQPRIHVEARRREGEWIFCVRDNGIGIAPSHFETIFEVFKRLHSQQAYPGTGIGLAVCRRVIERHGGRIWVDSEPGKGSSFFFSIPAQAEMPPLRGRSSLRANRRVS